MTLGGASPWLGRLGGSFRRFENLVGPDCDRLCLISAVVRVLFFQLRLRNADTMLGVAEREIEDAESNKRYLEV